MARVSAPSALLGVTLLYGLLELAATAGRAHDLEVCKTSAGVGVDHSLVQRVDSEQLRSQLVSRAQRRSMAPAALAQVDRAVASSIRARRMDPAALGAAIRQGVEAVKVAMPHFKAQPPRIGEGIGVLGTELFACVGGLVRSDFQTQEAFEDFRTSWMRFFAAVPYSFDEIRESLEAYNEHGEPKQLIAAVSTLFTEVSNGVLTFLPPETGNELGRFFDAVDDVFGAIGASWDMVENGQLTDGVEVLYWGLRNATDPIVPNVLKNDTTYASLTGALDVVVSDLSDTVMKYRQHVVEASVCWRFTASRERTRPQICPDDLVWNGEQFCFPRPAAALIASGNAASEDFDAAAARKADAATSGKGTPTGALPAVCDESTEFKHKHGHWCYAPCPAGFLAADAQCRVSCVGEFQAEGGSVMCGKSSVAIAKAVMQMVVETLKTLATVGEQLDEMRARGIAAEPLAGTIQALINLGVPFAYDSCPAPETQADPLFGAR